MEDFFTKVLNPFLKFKLVLTKRKVQESLSEKTEIGKDSLNTQLLKNEIEKIERDFELMSFKAFSP
jgi:hypothetical protein